MGRRRAWRARSQQLGLGLVLRLLCARSAYAGQMAVMANGGRRSARKRQKARSPAALAAAYVTLPGVSGPRLRTASRAKSFQSASV